jgi:hypothetical protein
VRFISSCLGPDTNAQKCEKDMEIYLVGYVLRKVGTKNTLKKWRRDVPNNYIIFTAGKEETSDEKGSRLRIVLDSYFGFWPLAFAEGQVWI